MKSKIGMEIHSFICDKCKDEIHIGLHETLPAGWALLSIFTNTQQFHLCNKCTLEVISTFQPFIPGNEYKP